MSNRPIAIKINGMHCGGCAANVEAALRAVPGVTGVVVDLARETATVEGSRPDLLIAAVVAAGFGAALD